MGNIPIDTDLSFSFFFSCSLEKKFMSHTVLWTARDLHILAGKQENEH